MKHVKQRGRLKKAPEDLILHIKQILLKGNSLEDCNWRCFNLVKYSLMIIARTVDYGNKYVN